MKLLLIIPAYNEEGNIERVIEGIRKNFPQFEYIIINDGSKDKTGKICKKKGYNCIDLPINLGLAGAFQTGMKYASAHGYDCAIQFDADGQHQPEYIEALRREMEEKKLDIVIGSRFVTEKKDHSLRMLGNSMISAAIRLTTGVKINDPTSGMRLYGKNVINEFAKNMNYGPEPDTISFLLRNGVKVGEVQVKMKERESGESYLTLTKSCLYMLRMMISILLIQNFRKRDR